jgi:hypothetical protein
MEDLGDFNRGLRAIETAIVRALSENGIKSSSISKTNHGSGRIPDSTTLEVIANGSRIAEAFTKNEVLDAGTGVDQMAAASRIRGIAARIAGLGQYRAQ